ncbi:MAG: hypothetical protein H6699_07350 [Myxococcales bacterium]|nr:hypothetical protein [Myxococcales bacterium]
MDATRSRARARALHASAAVTMCGSLAACGGSSAPPSLELNSTADRDLFLEAPSEEHPPRVTRVGDAPLPAVDTQVELGAEGCSATADGVCPEGCNRSDDADCCESADLGDGSWCRFDPRYGCSCAVEGPFAPPADPRR